MTTQEEENQESILLFHGSGGKLTRDLIDEIFLPKIGNRFLEPMDDAAVIPIKNSKLCFTTDTFVVKPIFFPGGDIGHLALCGTINDIAVMGGEVLGISTAFIIEEGFKIKTLKKIVASMEKIAKAAGVSIVTGDTKVVEKGSIDKIFINTSAIGLINEKLLCLEPISAGDKIIINGTLGDHGISVLSARENLPIEANIKSDCAPLNLLISPVLKKFPKIVKFMRDATRGGLATVLNEIVKDKNYGILIYEELIPIKENVRGVCQILGLDPLYIANEGKTVFIVKKESADDILEHLKRLPLGKDARIIGEVTKENSKTVILKNSIGCNKILDLPIGDQLPRIC